MHDLQTPQNETRIVLIGLACIGLCAVILIHKAPFLASTLFSTLSSASSLNSNGQVIELFGLQWQNVAGSTMHVVHDVSLLYQLPCLIY